MRLLWQFAHFHGIGTLGAGVNLLTLFIVHELVGVPVYFSLCISFTCAVIFNFICIKTWTFKEREWKIPAVTRQFAQFYLIAVTGLGLNLLLFFGFHEFLLLGIYISQIIALAIAAPYHFVLNKLFTFPTLTDRPNIPAPGLSASGVGN